MTIAASALPAASFFAPTGRLRACINLGNPVLAQRDPQTQAVVGVSVDMARAFAQRLGVAVGLQVVESASQSVQAVTQGQADIGFFAIDPLRGAGIAFTAPYVLIEGGYLVPQASATHAADEVDRPGMRVAVGKGSAYDLFLSRTLQHAQIVRSPTPSGVVEMFLAQGLEVAAGIKQALQAEAQRLPGLRLLPGRFMVIEQAMGCPKALGPQAAQLLHAFVEEHKANGFVAQALARHGIQGCTVAPAHPA